jgi:hypothetical protein
MSVGDFVGQRVERLEAVSGKVKVFFLVVILIVGVALLVVAETNTQAATGYTTAVFAGGFIATILAGLLLLNSRHLKMVVKDDERERLKKAAVALLFDSNGCLVLHLQDPSGTESWPNYWVPPGGLVEEPLSLPETARNRLQLLVDDKHEWPEGIFVAHTNDSKKYRDINKKETQPAVEVSAFLFNWSDSDPFVPDHQLPERRLRFVNSDNAPSNMPEYYSELLEYLDRLRVGERSTKSLECWKVQDENALIAHLRAETRIQNV